MSKFKKAFDKSLTDDLDNQDDEEEFNEKLLLPILKDYSGALPPEIAIGLRRFVEEFDYPNKEKYNNIINQNI